MKLSLPLRIFVVHLLFMLALGALGVWVIQREFTRYAERWEESLESLPPAQLFSQPASELARSLLLALSDKRTEEARESSLSRFSDALDRVLPTLPSVQRLVIVDSELQVQYASHPSTLELTPTDPDVLSGLAVVEPTLREVGLPSGGKATERIVPLFDRSDRSNPRPQRLGTALVRYRPPGLTGGQPPAPAPEAGPGPLDPWIEEVSESLLRELQQTEEQAREEYKHSVSEGLNTIIRALPIDSMIVVDRDRRIQYASDATSLDLKFTGVKNETFFAGTEPSRRAAEQTPVAGDIELMIPVFEHSANADAVEERRRLGSVLVRYRPDPALLARIPSLQPLRVGPRDYIKALTILLVVAVAGGIVLAALSGLPVRRMERALSDFKARGFRGGLDATRAGLPKDLASMISELGGQLEALDAQGRERADLLATLSQSLEDGMVAFDPRGTPVAWNPAALRLLGAEPVEGDGNEVDRVRQAIEANPDLQFTVDRIDAVEAREVEIRRADGSVGLARVTRLPFEMRPGETGTQLLIRDLAALRKVEAHLLEAGRFAVLAHLAASLAHEIRNPLHAIQLSATVVEQYVDTSGADKTSRAVAESLSSIKDEARRLAELLNNYLGMVRPGGDTGPVDIRDLCHRVIQLVRHAAQKSNIEIRLEGVESLPMVHGMANRLQQAILNLVLNAIQAMPDGGRLTLTTNTVSDVVRITVSDTGPGLPAGMDEQLFDTRVTTKPKGSGLGLPLVRWITEAHGGGVWYRSVPGEGASFTLVIPASEEQPPVESIARGA